MARVGERAGASEVEAATGEARCSVSESVVTQERGLAARLVSSRGTRQTRADHVQEYGFSRSMSRRTAPLAEVGAELRVAERSRAMVLTSLATTGVVRGQAERRECAVCRRSWRLKRSEEEIMQARETE
jgi:hypothetical protein